MSSFSPESDPKEVNYTAFQADDAEESFPTRAGDDTKIQPADLFSLFTADIIKEERIFTR